MIRETPTGLTLVEGVDLWTLRRTERIVTTDDGRRAKLTVDDSGTVVQRERDDGLDALVVPRAIRIRIPVRSPR